MNALIPVLNHSNVNAVTRHFRKVVIYGDMNVPILVLNYSSVNAVTRHFR